jgi:hypothetical protein
MKYKSYQVKQEGRIVLYSALKTLIYQGRRNILRQVAQPTASFMLAPNTSEWRLSE